MEIQRRKEQAVTSEDFDEAERMKLIIMNVRKFGQKLNSLKEKKHKAAEKEDYELAKSIKEEIGRLKREVDSIVSQEAGEGEAEE
jgi:excinuclease UvrABC helicase subunit UvrB